MLLWADSTDTKYPMEVHMDGGVPIIVSTVYWVGSFTHSKIFPVSCHALLVTKYPY